MRELRGDQAKCFEEIRMFLKQSGGGMHILQGKAGTGKSFLMNDVIDYIHQNRAIKVAVTAPSHQAVKVLRRFIDAKSDFFTTHAALGMKEVIDIHGNRLFKKDPKLPCKAEDYNIIVVDEASMVNDDIFDELVHLVQTLRIKILFVGDDMQVPPVNHLYAKPFEKEMQSRYNIGVSTMDTIIRQVEGHPLISYASSIRENIHVPLQITDSQRVQNDFGGVFPIKEKESLPFFVENILPLYNSVEYKENMDYVKTIAWHNKVVDFYNKIIREFLFGENLPKIMVGDLLIADAPVVQDKRVLINTNEEMIVLGATVCEDQLSDDIILKYYNTRVRVFNGEIYNEYMIRIIHESSEATYNKLITLQKHLANSYPKGSYQARSAWIDMYQFIESWHQTKYAYAITGHKAQGSSYLHAFVLYWDIKTNPNIFERNRIYYTCVTRPSKNVYIVY